MAGGEPSGEQLEAPSALSAADVFHLVGGHEP